jgi:hypothetical protein
MLVEGSLVMLGVAVWLLLRAFGESEARQRLLDAGVAVRDDEEIPGVRRFYTDDPWGNRLELVAVS